MGRRKIGKNGPGGEAYSITLGVGTLDPERSDVLSKIRKDFDAAGVVQSDEQIIEAIDDLMLQAGNRGTMWRRIEIGEHSDLRRSWRRYRASVLPQEFRCTPLPCLPRR